MTHPMTQSPPLQWCWPFNQPVDTNIYKDYLEVVRTPMDFGTIKRRIEHGGSRGSAGKFGFFRGFTLLAMDFGTIQRRIEHGGCRGSFLYRPHKFWHHQPPHRARWVAHSPARPTLTEIGMPKAF